VRSDATRFASAQEVLPIGFHPSDNNFVACLHVESVLSGYEAENRFSSPTHSCSRQVFLQIQRLDRTEKGVSALTFTSMITSNRNEHDRSDIRGTRRDNVEAHPVDVEIESRHNSNLAASPTDNCSAHGNQNAGTTATTTTVTTTTTVMTATTTTAAAEYCYYYCEAHGNQNAGTTTLRLDLRERLLPLLLCFRPMSGSIAPRLLLPLLLLLLCFCHDYHYYYCYHEPILLRQLLRTPSTSIQAYR
jgi:hypothetical protein